MPEARNQTSNPLLFKNRLASSVTCLISLFPRIVRLLVEWLSGGFESLIACLRTKRHSTAYGLSNSDCRDCSIFEMACDNCMMLFIGFFFETDGWIQSLEPFSISIRMPQFDPFSLLFEATALTNGQDYRTDLRFCLCFESLSEIIRLEASGSEAVWLCQ